MLKELYKILEPWCLEEGTPEDNKMIYCPACGRKIKVVKTEN